MAGFEHYSEEIRELEREIERKGIVLGIDWTDEVQVRALAREALEHGSDEVQRVSSGSADRKLMAKVDLYGLAALMLRTMEETAGIGFETHGGSAWKSLGKALWQEAEIQKKAP